MLAAIATNVLNVRNMPLTSSKVIGQLTQGMVVAGDKPRDGWMQIGHKQSFGFISAHYIKPVNDLRRLTGTVNASTLNVRAQPNATGELVASLAQGASVKTLAFVDDWLEIEFNGQTAYVAAKYVDLVYTDNGYYCEVTTPLLNVRSVPMRSGTIFGQVAAGTQVWVESTQQDWSQIRFNGNRGYVASRFIKRVDEEAEPEPIHKQVLEDESDELTIIPQSNQDQQMERLTPSLILTVDGTRYERAVAATWNRWGALLQKLSDQKELDVACVVSVLCVESSGKGFEQNNANKMIIRFENHKFWKYWGKLNPQQFRQHFSYRSGEAWKDHKWRAEVDDPWQSFHGNQAGEWAAFEFARKLDEEAAMLSISMGAPQIMGFNYQAIGYQSVIEMFQAFSTSIQGQIEGLFDFCSTRMLKNLRDLNFEDFAGLYNGSGQKQKYGQWIQQHFDAFKKIYRD